MKKKIIIEFSENRLKAVILSVQALRSEIENIILEPLEPDFANISFALSKVFTAQNKKKGIDVTVVVNRGKITLRKIDLPSRDPNEIEQMLALHVIRQVPYSKEEIIWGYNNLGFDGITSTHILLAIVHRDVLKKIFNAFVSINILPDKMLVSSQGIMHYIYCSIKDKSVIPQDYLILDIDADSSDLLLIDKQQLHSTVVISQGIQQLKSEEGMLRFSAELKQALSALSDKFSYEKNAQLFVTGMTVNVNRLEDYFKNELNLKTRFIELKDAENRKLAIKDVSVTAILGFAYRQAKDDICFTLPEAQIKKDIRRKIQQLLILGSCLAYVFVLLGLIVSSLLSRRQSYLEKFNAKIESVKEKTGPLLQISQHLETAKQYITVKYSVLNYLYETTRLCPDSVIVMNFYWERQKGFAVRGYAEQMQDIFDFANALGGAEIFKGVEVRSTRRHKVKNKEIVDFEIGLK